MTLLNNGSRATALLLALGLPACAKPAVVQQPKTQEFVSAGDYIVASVAIEAVKETQNMLGSIIGIVSHQEREPTSRRQLDAALAAIGNYDISQTLLKPGESFSTPTSAYATMVTSNATAYASGKNRESFQQIAYLESVIGQSMLGSANHIQQECDLSHEACLTAVLSAKDATQQLLNDLSVAFKGATANAPLGPFPSP